MELAQIIQAVKNEHSKPLTESIAQAISPDTFHALIHSIPQQDFETGQRLSWVIGKVCDLRPALLAGCGHLLFELVSQPNQHDAIYRNGLKTLAECELYEDLQSAAYDLGLKYFKNPTYPVAIRVHGLQIAANIARPYPELVEELMDIVQTIEIQADCPPGLISRFRKVRKLLKVS